MIGLFNDSLLIPCATPSLHLFTYLLLFVVCKGGNCPNCEWTSATSCSACWVTSHAHCPSSQVGQFPCLGRTGPESCSTGRKGATVHGDRRNNVFYSAHSWMQALTFSVLQQNYTLNHTCQILKPDLIERRCEDRHLLDFSLLTYLAKYTTMPGLEKGSKNLGF